MAPGRGAGRMRALVLGVVLAWAGMSAAQATSAVTVVSNGWHTGLVLRRSDVAVDRIPELADLRPSTFIEFGWGDAEYYPAQDPTLAMALWTGIVATPAVMHVAASDLPPGERYADVDVVELVLDDAQMARLVDHIAASFDRGTESRVAAVGPGLYTDSLFFPATGEFHIANTCNTWTARALFHAGFDVRVDGTVRAEDLMGQLNPAVTR